MSSVCSRTTFDDALHRADVDERRHVPGHEERVAGERFGVFRYVMDIHTTLSDPSLKNVTVRC